LWVAVSDVLECGGVASGSDPEVFPRRSSRAVFHIPGFDFWRPEEPGCGVIAAHQADAALDTRHCKKLVLPLQKAEMKMAP
jgi:hypothetical protein